VKKQYVEINFRAQTLALIDRVNSIVDEYHGMGYDLTLRQVYYQLVARDVIPNNERSYKSIGNIISEGRLAGLIDWEAIVDRTRNLRRNSHWESPSDIIHSAAYSFAYDKWEGQEYYCEVWVEKDALVGVVGQICTRLDVPFFSCRGYVSQSEMWSAAQRLLRRKQNGQRAVIIHLGDHDPSGIDMSRDIVDRLTTFEITPIYKRIALNKDQIERYNPPPNPTKLSDSRCHGYIQEHGYECWELDALRPNVIEELIDKEVSRYCDKDLFKDVKNREEAAKRVLKEVAYNWQEIEDQYA
jgi:hypothetical protein